MNTSSPDRQLHPLKGYGIILAEVIGIPHPHEIQEKLIALGTPIRKEGFVSKEPLPIDEVLEDPLRSAELTSILDERFAARWGNIPRRRPNSAAPEIFRTLSGIYALEGWMFSLDEMAEKLGVTTNTAGSFRRRGILQAEVVVRELLGLPPKKDVKETRELRRQADEALRAFILNPSAS